MLLILFFSAKLCCFHSQEEGTASPSMQVGGNAAIGTLGNQWVYSTQPLGKTGEIKASLVIAGYQLLILATQQYFWGQMIALKGPCDVSSAIQKQRIIFNLGHFTTFLPTSLPGFIPYYDSYTGIIFFSHCLKSRSYQSRINNSWASMPAMCGNKLYVCERKSSGGTKIGTNECKRH